MRKKVSVFLLFLLGIFPLFAQQTDKEIAQIVKHCELLLQKYDDGSDSVYAIIQQQIAKSTDSPANNAIWNCYMAKFLDSYRFENQYRIESRTPIEGKIPSDFKLWDIQTLKHQILVHCQNAVKNRDFLAQIPIENYSEIIKTKEDLEKRPTLYDFMVYEIVETLLGEIYQEKISQEKIYLQDNHTFAKLDLTNLSDDIPFQLIIKSLQSLTQIHLTKSPQALIETSLERLQCYTLWDQPDFQENRLTYLHNLEEEFRNKKDYERICWKLAEQYFETNKLEAVKWCNRTIEVAPNSPSATKAQELLCKNDFARISFSFPEVIIPHEPTLLNLKLENCEKLYFRIIPMSKQKFKQIKEQQKGRILKEHFIYDTVLHPNWINDYELHSAYFLLPGLPNGEYVLCASKNNFSTSDNSFACEFVQVSHIDLVYRAEEGDFFVINRKTGEPIHNAKVNIKVVGKKSWQQNPIALENITLTTDKNGKINYHYLAQERFVDLNYNVEINALGESFKKQINLFYQRPLKNNSLEQFVKITIFTDRNLYRPGQKIYFKGVLKEEVRQNENLIEQNLLENYSTKVSLFSSNGIELKTLTLQSNSFGSFSGAFDLPENTLPGEFRIIAKCDKTTAYHYFSVEEYKRPTYEVTLSVPEDQYAFNQDIKVNGKIEAYAGYALSNAQVNYKIWINTSRYYESLKQPIEQGTITSSENGDFSIEFTLETPNNIAKPYHITIVAEVVDITGEMQNAEISFPIAQQALQIESEISNQISIDDNNLFSVKLLNYANKLQQSELHYTIESLESPETFLHNCDPAEYFLSDSAKLVQAFPHLDLLNSQLMENRKVKNIVNSGTISVNDSSHFSIPNLKNYKPGYYKITFSTQDNFGNEVKKEDFVFIFDKSQKRCAAYEPIWVTHSEKNSVKTGDTLEITLGSYLKDAIVMCEIFSKGKLKSTEKIILSQENKKINYIVDNEDVGGIIQYFFFTIQNNFHYDKSIEFEVKDREKNIDFEFLTFRDKTVPGNREQYKIRLKNAQGEKVMAELLCSMYDASLDALTMTKPWKSVFSFQHKLRYNHSLTFNQYYLAYKNYYKDCDIQNYNIETYFGLIGNFSTFDYYFSTISTNSIPDGVHFEENLEEDALNKYSFKSNLASENDLEEEFSSSIRKNFDETSFFYPHLQTDENGDILISFTIPESLTRWKMRGFAHSHGEMQGYFERFIQTQKPLMVVSNAPRFLREGDSIDFAVKVVNMSDSIQNGIVKISFWNAVNHQPINILIGDSLQTFQLNAQGSQQFYFPISVPKGVSALTYRIETINSGTPKFADGEESTLIILPNRMLVTETLPFAITGTEAKTFQFEKLQNPSKTAETHALTFEFSPNPISYVLQSLPYLMENDKECSERLFNRYYANAITSKIINSHPEIKSIFQKWIEENSDLLCSQLEKNQELKLIALEETPWLLDAKNESENRQNLQRLFNEQRVRAEQNLSLEKLANMQNFDGGWSWFSKGNSNQYITQYILTGFGHLKALGIENSSNASVLKAIQYIDACEGKSYQERKKKNLLTNNSLNIQYLYARSFFLNRNLSGKSREAYNFYYANLKKNWKQQSIYMQAMSALIFYRNSDEILAKEVLAHIKKYAQYSDEMGMFWKKEGRGLFWHEAPIERQALLIEAFHTILNDKEAVEMMQTWLLRQKQTQAWESSRATADACYALLLNKTTTLTSQQVKASVGNWSYNNTTNNSAFGYVKQSWSADEVSPAMATINVQKESDGVAWGALYWQYWEDLDKITESKDQELAIHKQLFKISSNKNSDVLIPITKNSPLKVGDKVKVRVEIRNTMDMEFVHLKDMRAAAFEPISTNSQHHYQDGLYYYEAISDVATHFYFDYLPKGTYVFEYTLNVTLSGNYSNGITSIQCMYAPEFSSHSDGINVTIKNER